MLQRCTFILLIACFAAPLSAAADRPVRVGIFDYEPAIYRNSEGKVEGFFAELLAQVAADNGWSLQFVHGSWDDGLKRLRKGEVDLLTSVAYTEERARYMDYCEEPLLTVWGEVYVHEGSDIDNIHELEGKSIAVMEGDYNARVFRTHVDAFGINCVYLEFPNFSAVFKAVQSGDADAGVINSTVGAGIGPKYSVKGTGVVFNPFNIHFTVRKGRNGEVLAALQENLVKWKADPDSVYYRGLKTWLRRDVGVKHVVPEAVWQGGVLLAGLLCAAVLISFFLRSRVRKATEELFEEKERYRNLAEELRTSQEKYHQLVEGMEDLITSVDSAGAMLFVNHRAEAVFGMTPEACIGRNAFDFIHEDDRERTRTWFESHVTQQSRRGVIENRQVSASGAVRRVLWNCTFHYNGNGELLRVDSIARDITQRKAMEEQLAHSQRMDAIGQLAGGVAHDFNNLLGGILGAAELVGKRVTDDKIKHYVELIRKTSLRGADLTNKLLAFGRKGATDLAALDMHRVLDETVEILRRTINKNVTIHTTWAAAESVVLGDFAQLQNVFLNMGINAAHAMPEGGNLTIVTAMRTLSEEDCGDGRLAVLPGSYIGIEVQDTGCGMAPETLARVFEPFFTTREQGKGTGLGLAAAYGTVQEHKGSICVDSVPGKGTTFYVLLPLSDLPIETTAAPSESRTGAGCILVVDDDDVMREMAGDMLEDAGYETLAAASGAEAIDLYQEHAGQIDLVLLDMIMPEMDGHACLKELRRLDSGVRVLISSGFIKDAAVDELLAGGALGFIHKPFRMTELGQAVARACGNGQAGKGSQQLS